MQTIVFSVVLKAEKIGFFTDASGSHKLGYGCIFKDNWTFGTWGEDFIKKDKPSIEYLELYAVAVAIVLWSEKLANKRVRINCDNQSVVSMINKTVSSCKSCMRLLRTIVLTSGKFNVRFFADYLETKKNVSADALSRLDFERFWSRVPNTMAKYPTQLPNELLPPGKFFY